MLYKVYYKKDTHFEFDKELTMLFLLGHHFAFIKETEAKDLDDLYNKMQGEVWSPHGEARELILKAGVDHTSISIGDVAIDPEGRGWQVARFGWERVPHVVTEETRNKVKDATELFNRLSTEIYFGLNMTMVLADLPEAEIAVINSFLEKCETGRTDPWKSPVQHEDQGSEA